MNPISDLIDAPISRNAVIRILLARWATTRRDGHGGLETVFRGGLSEILDDIRNLPEEGQHEEE